MSTFSVNRLARRAKVSARRRNHFYGWNVVGAMFFGMLLVMGTRNGFGVFVDNWEREWGVTTGEISIAAAIGWIVNGCSQPILGKIVDRYGGKVVVVVSTVVLGISYLLLAFIDGVIMLAVLFGGVISFFAGGISPGTAGAVITRWFQRKRGMAMSVVAAGGSLGGLVMVPFLAQLMLATNWQTTWFVSGILVLVFGLPVSILIIRNSPDEMGVLPDGEARAKGSQASADQRMRAQSLMSGGPLGSERWTEAFKSWPMWQLSIGYFVCGITTASISTHFVRWAISEDISQANAAWAFGILMGINAGGVILIGLLSDVFQRHYLLALVYLVRGVAFVTLIILPGSMAMWAFAAIGGASWLATVPLTTGLTADVYGVRNVGMLGGLINFSHQMGGGAAVLLFGLTFDRLGTYDPAFAAGAICLAVAGIVILTIKETKYSVRYAPSRSAAKGVAVTAG